MFMPFQALGMLVRGVVSLVLVACSITLFVLWYQNRERAVVEHVDVAPSRAEVRQDQDEGKPVPPVVEETRVRVVPWEFGWNLETAYLLGSLFLMTWSIGGGRVFSPWLWRRSGGGDEFRQGSVPTTERLRRPDGSELLVASYGPADGEPIVCTHGWGLDHMEWVYASRELAAYRLITWDLPGLGSSTRPTDRDWSLEKLARDLDAVITFAGGKPVTLLGHSIGTMITLTYCKLFPEALGSRVRGIVLAHGTYTNPVKTTSNAGLHTALQKPVLEPLCHLMIWLSPAFRVLNWLSYVNGSAHRSTERSSFSGKETRGQLDFMARYYCQSAPDVVARGMLAMLRYDATEVLPRITVPTLIVTGDRDTTCTPEASRFMAKAIPNAELVTLSPAKHCGLFEWHEQFDEALLAFVAGADDRARDAETRKSVGEPSVF